MGQVDKAKGIEAMKERKRKVSIKLLKSSSHYLVQNLGITCQQVNMF